MIYLHLLSSVEADDTMLKIARIEFVEQRSNNGVVMKFMFVYLSWNKIKASKKSFLDCDWHLLQEYLIAKPVPNP